jgi:anti-anti-sigma regulatory factor
MLITCPPMALTAFRPPSLSSLSEHGGTGYQILKRGQPKFTSLREIAIERLTPTGSNSKPQGEHTPCLILLCNKRHMRLLVKLRVLRRKTTSSVEFSPGGKSWTPDYFAAFSLYRRHFIWILRLLDYTLMRGFVWLRVSPIRRAKLARILIHPNGGVIMAIDSVSDDILLVTLPEQPQNGNEIDLVNKMLSQIVDHDVVMDFGNVKMLTSSTICGLMILDRLLRGGGRQFILCSVPSEIKQVFTRTGLLSVFELSDDQDVAIEEVRSRRLSWAGT